MSFCCSNNNLNPEAAKAIAQGLSKNQSVETIMVRHTDDNTLCFLSYRDMVNRGLCTLEPH